MAQCPSVPPFMFSYQILYDICMTYIGKHYLHPHFTFFYSSAGTFKCLYYFLGGSDTVNLLQHFFFVLQGKRGDCVFESRNAYKCHEGLPYECCHCHAYFQYNIAGLPFKAQHSVVLCLTILVITLILLFGPCSFSTKIYTENKDIIFTPYRLQISAKIIFYFCDHKCHWLHASVCPSKMLQYDIYFLLYHYFILLWYK